MYDPVIGQYEYLGQTLPTVPFVQKNNNLLNFNDTFLAQLDDAYVNCGYKEYNEKYLTFPPPGVQPPLDGMFNATSDSCDVWTLSYTAAYQPNPCFNVYEISSMCPIPSDPLGFPSDLQYQYPGMGGLYFNRSDVKTAMHGKTLTICML
jgi:carboxypeptidase D